MGLLIVLLIGFVMALITAAIAGSKGHDRLGWGFVGFVFGLIGVLIACCLSDKRSLEQLEGAAYWR